MMEEREGKDKRDKRRIKLLYDHKASCSKKKQESEMGLADGLCNSDVKFKFVTIE